MNIHHVDAHVPKSRTNEEHQNNKQVDQAAKIEVSEIDLDWQHKGELLDGPMMPQVIKAEMPPIDGHVTKGWI